MENCNLLFIFTLKAFKHKVVIQGYEYQHVCEALIKATEIMQKQWGIHNQSFEEEKLKGLDTGREYVDFAPENVQIVELPSF